MLLTLLRFISRFVFAFSAVFITGYGYADLEMKAELSQASWHYSGSRDQCQLFQRVPHFGLATFVSDPKNKLKFDMVVVRPLAASGKFEIVETAPAWHPDAPARTPLGIVDAIEGLQLSIGSPLSDRMLMSLYRGYEPHFNRLIWFDTQARVDVTLRSIRFREMYESFVQCQSNLLVDMYSELERSTLQFAVSQWDIKGVTARRLQRLSRFLNDDESITRVFIDSHTDNSGGTKSNLKLSKNRAENVEKLLLDAGVDKSLLTVRYHADRYPIASNKTLKGRERNRRTTIRLERKADAGIGAITSASRD
ncbi:MAG: OmpA family protein [Pseudomonadales bacterium]|nr:OmpA family protein [Pseudomonadales bacterium]